MIRRMTDREMELEREVERLRTLLASDPSTMRMNIQSMWGNIEKQQTEIERLRRNLTLATEMAADNSDDAVRISNERDDLQTKLAKACETLKEARHAIEAAIPFMDCPEDCPACDRMALAGRHCEEILKEIDE